MQCNFRPSMYVYCARAIGPDKIIILYDVCELIDNAHTHLLLVVIRTFWGFIVFTCGWRSAVALNYGEPSFWRAEKFVGEKIKRNAKKTEEKGKVKNDRLFMVLIPNHNTFSTDSIKTPRRCYIFNISISFSLILKYINLVFKDFDTNAIRRKTK